MTHKHTKGDVRNPRDSPSRNRRPRLSYFADYVVCFAILFSSFTFVVIPPANTRFYLEDPMLNYPAVEEQATSVIYAILFLAVPILGLLVLNRILRYSWHDYHHAFLSLFQALVGAWFTASFMWWCFGGLRPSFLAACDPDPAKIFEPTPTERIVYYDRSICRNPVGMFHGETGTVYDAMRSMPAGHAATSWATLVVFTLYMLGKFRPWDGRGHFWKLALSLFPLFLCGWLSLTRVVDGQHTLLQLWVGIVIGTIWAILAYHINFFPLWSIYSDRCVASTWKDNDEHNFGVPASEATYPSSRMSLPEIGQPAREYPTATAPYPPPPYMPTMASH